MRVNVKDSLVIERTINGKNGPQILRDQRAALDLGGGYELPFRVGLGTGPVHPVGVYDLDPACFSLNAYGDLTMGRVRLVPVAQEPARRAASASA